MDWQRLISDPSRCRARHGGARLERSDRRRQRFCYWYAFFLKVGYVRCRESIVVWHGNDAVDKWQSISSAALPCPDSNSGNRPRFHVRPYCCYDCSSRGRVGTWPPRDWLSWLGCGGRLAQKNRDPAK